MLYCDNQLPTIGLDINYVETIRFSGAGGKEKLLAKIFSSENVKRVNNAYYDFIVDGVKIETKRQRRENWFDHGKYYNMTDEVKNIVMMFIMHDGAKITDIVGITLSNLITLVCADSDCQKDGWTTEVMSHAHFLKQKYPSLEHKAKLNMRKLLQRYPNMFKIYY